MNDARTTVARWISIVLHPFATVALLVGVASYHSAPQRVFQTVLLVCALSIAPVAILIFRQVHRGRWANVDASNPAERPILFTVAIAALALLAAWLLLTEPRSFLLRGVAVTAAMLIVAALLTPWIKVSLHLSFATYAATALSLSGSLAGYLLAAAIPLLAWSRVALERHRAIDLATGIAVGLVAGIVLNRLS